MFSTYYHHGTNYSLDDVTITNIIQKQSHLNKIILKIFSNIENFLYKSNINKYTINIIFNDWKFNNASLNRIYYLCSFTNILSTPLNIHNKTFKHKNDREIIKNFINLALYIFTKNTFFEKSQSFIKEFNESMIYFDNIYDQNDQNDQILNDCEILLNYTQNDIKHPHQETQSPFNSLNDFHNSKYGVPIVFWVGLSETLNDLDGSSEKPPKLELPDFDVTEYYDSKSNSDPQWNKTTKFFENPSPTHVSQI